MLTEPGGPFIDVSKINLGKYANRPALAKVSERVVHKFSVCLKFNSRT